MITKTRPLRAKFPSGGSIDAKFIKSYTTLIADVSDDTLKNYDQMLIRSFAKSIKATIGFTVTTLSLSAFNAHSETLLEVYELALKNDLQYQSNLARYNADREAENIGKAELLPEISFQASRIYADRDSNNDAFDSDSNTKSYLLRLSQPIINFSALNTYRSGKVQTLAAEARLAADQLELIIRSAEAYFDVLRAIDQLRTSQAEEKALATQLKQTRQRFEVGLIPINDVQETRAAYDSAVANRLGAELNVTIEFEALAIITGKNHTNIAPLKDDFVATLPEPNDKEVWISAATKNNLPLQVVKLAADAARYDAKAARAGRYPELTGAISYGNEDRNISGSTITESDSDTDTASIRLDLNIPLYTGGGLSAKDRQAQQNEIRLRQEFLFTQRETVQRTRGLFFAVNIDISQIKARKQAIVSSQSALKATQAGYEAGTRDIVDVVDSQRDLFQAQRDYFTALYDYIIRSLQLKNEAGSLSVQDLKLLEGSLRADKKVGS